VNPSENTNGNPVAPTPFDAVATVLKTHFFKPDLDAAKIVYAAVAAHRLSGTPVWPMLIGPPGSSKTTLVEPLDGLPSVHLIDSVTPRTFISGQIPDPARPAQQPASLLLRIGSSGILVAPDFSTVLEGKHDDRAKIFSDLRRIYDGQLRKEYGTAGAERHEWRGRLTFITCVTPAVDGYTAVFQSLGERFLQVRLPRADGVEAALAAMAQDTAAAKAALRAALHELFASLPNTEPVLLPETLRRIASLAEFTVKARTHVQRSGYGNKEMIALPEPESATRLAQQLAQLAKGLALLDGRDHVNDDDYRLVQRTAADNIPPIRRKILEAISSGKPPSTSGLPASTCSYHMKDLEAVGLLQDQQLSPLAWDLLNQAGCNVKRPEPKTHGFAKA
jgi:hypothetical protein